jgi:hypothetical protein
MFQTSVGFTIKAVSRKSKLRSFQEIEKTVKIDLDNFTLTD